MKGVCLSILIGTLLWSTNSLTAGAPGIQINEIRTDQPGTDVDEYFELIGDPAASLSGLSYVVIGDGAGGSGVVENVFDLGGNAINGNGFFVVATDTFTLGVADLVVPNDSDGILENSDNVTHLLVSDFSGALDDDLDTDDDGALDVTPWTAIVDCVAIVGPPGNGDLVYCATTVGPNGAFVPGHVYSCPGLDLWAVGDFDAGVNDSPGAVNDTCDCGTAGSGNCFQDTGTPLCNDEDCCVEVCFIDETCCSVIWDADCAALALDNCTVGGPAPDVTLNEIRTKQGGTDADEYFELLAEPFTLLDGVFYIVIGGNDLGGDGVIENVTDLGGLFVPASGHLVGAEASFTLGTPDLTIENLNFEDDNTTHLLVFNFTGSDGDDLDLDDDGMLDVEPWGELIDSVAIVDDGIPGQDDETNHVYSPTIVGPDEIFTPGHIYLCDEADPMSWTIGEFDIEDPGAVDSPGAVNEACGFIPPCGASAAGGCFEDNGTANCDSFECCELVCALPGFENCCDPGAGWDQDCADTAILECLSCGTSDASNCFEPNPTPYCSDAKCCEAVCDTLPDCCMVEWTQECVDLAFADCEVPETPNVNDLAFGLNDADSVATLELVRGPLVMNGGVAVPDPWDEPFMQSMEFDNLDGIGHNPQGNLLGVNFGSTADGGSIHSLATCIPVPTDQQIADTTNVTTSRLGGLSVSPDNSKIAVIGYDSQNVIVYDYTAGDCNGAGGFVSGDRETAGQIMCSADTQGSAWLDNNTVLAFSTTGEIYAVNATTMEANVAAAVDTVEGCGPGFTDIEFNPQVSPFVYAMYSSFTAATANRLFVLDPDDNFNLVGTFDYSTSMNTSREIAFDSEGNLFVNQFGGGTGAAVDVILDAANPESLADNNSIEWYTSPVLASFSGMDIAASTGMGLPCPWDCADPADGQVSIVDLLDLLAQWGGMGPCDFDGGGVAITDLLLVLANWGPCP